VLVAAVLVADRVTRDRVAEFGERHPLFDLAVVAVGAALPVAVGAVVADTDFERHAGIRQNSHIISSQSAIAMPAQMRNPVRGTPHNVGEIRLNVQPRGLCG
jgi:hypothetical protein